jgi:hypothetical protein
MPSPLRTYLDALRHFPFAVLQQPQHYFRRPGKDFTRRRSLYLERLVWLNITLLKTTLAVELDQFFDWLGTGEFSVTKSALVQARQKLLPRFFRDFFQFAVAAYYHAFKIHRWKGFRLWATDGSGFRLPDEVELGEAFGWHGNQYNSVPSARMLVCFDLLNNLVTALQFHTRNTAEIVVAMRSVCQIPSDVLMVYDRAYGSHIICLGSPAQLRAILSDYYRQILQTLEPERPGKNKERRRRIMRGTERHFHEKNYRRAF